MDGTGLAAVIAASVAGVVSLATLYMQYITWKDNRAIKLQTKALEIQGVISEKKLDSLHKQVNGRLGELKIRIAKDSFETGRHYEKENPGATSPEMPRSNVEKLMEEINVEKGDPIG